AASTSRASLTGSGKKTRRFFRSRLSANRSISTLKGLFSADRTIPSKSKWSGWPRASIFQIEALGQPFHFDFEGIVRSAEQQSRRRVDLSPSANEVLDAAPG